MRWEGGVEATFETSRDNQLGSFKWACTISLSSYYYHPRANYPNAIASIHRLLATSYNRGCGTSQNLPVSFSWMACPYFQSDQWECKPSFPDQHRFQFTLLTIKLCGNSVDSACGCI